MFLLCGIGLINHTNRDRNMVKCTLTFKPFHLEKTQVTCPYFHLAEISDTVATAN